VLAARRLERRDRAAAAVTVPEIAADEDDAGVQRPDEHALDELLGRLRGEGLVEREHERGQDTGRLETLDLLLGAAERFGSEGRIEEGERMPVERHDRRHE
jgi:hypothetical protein